MPRVALDYGKNAVKNEGFDDNGRNSEENKGIPKEN